MLVAIRLQQHLANAPEQLIEGRIAADVGSHREQRHATTHHTLEPRRVTTRVGDHERHAVVFRAAGQECVEGCGKRHEQRGAVSAAQLPQRLRQGPRISSRSDAPAKVGAPYRDRSTAGANGRAFRRCCVQNRICSSNSAPALTPCCHAT